VACKVAKLGGRPLYFKL